MKISSVWLPDQGSHPQRGARSGLAHKSPMASLSSADARDLHLHGRVTEFAQHAPRLVTTRAVNKRERQYSCHSISRLAPQSNF
jgi:hypothetical protein